MGGGAEDEEWFFGLPADMQASMGLRGCWGHRPEWER